MRRHKKGNTHTLNRVQKDFLKEKSRENVHRKVDNSSHFRNSHDHYQMSKEKTNKEFLSYLMMWERY